ncbi:MULTISPECIES: GNAT family N-acetyltransferase [Clostridium]|uniref:GNAT family N-acetyltransferase n=1 Tax=Clostridium aquiflavi TaxID=3073603 RepID=A0ABU1ECN1_9CLOT|nr:MULTISPECIES: GNAT family N-acetyltransferase [unclassified Clostridium]MDR5586137.1 GNAT family N-acetyltransferase [Clostridium sp. 5N-1]NFG61233.1 GNAT family N-acetyltransferase [Clostridium botulinum]NFQ08979.1 GNAT family N-acetyltransferase [Clostridium botulinum]
MVDVEFYYEDFEITSVKKSDIDRLNKWIILNDKFSVDLFSLDQQLFFRRFLEYYLTEEELFLKIEKDNEIYGVFKGRLELQEKSELFIWLYLIDSRFRNKGLGKNMLIEILQYFKSKYCIECFKVGVNSKNKRAVKFWNNSGFNKLRIAKNFFEDSKYETSDLLILNKIS